MIASLLKVQRYIRAKSTAIIEEGAFKSERSANISCVYYALIH